MRILSRVLFHGIRHTAIRIAFTQHWIHGASLHLVVAGTNLLFLISRRLVRIVGKRVTLLLKLRNCRLQLRYRSADVREFDDVGLGLFRQFSELSQRIRNPLILRQLLRKYSDNAPRERYVASLDSDVT